MHKYTALASPFLRGCYTVRWSGITKSCCVSVWNMKWSRYTIFSAQGWTELVYTDLVFQFLLLSVSCSFSCVKCKRRAWGKRCLLLQQIFKSSTCAMCDLRLTLGSISSFCFCFVTVRQCLDCGEKHLRWDRGGETCYVRHETSAIVTKKMEQYAMRAPVHSKPQPS